MANSTPQPPVPAQAGRGRTPLVTAYKPVSLIRDRRVTWPTTGKIVVAVRYDGAGLEWAVTLGHSDIGVVRGRGQRDVAMCPRFLTGPGTTRRPVTPRRGERTGHARFAGRRARPTWGRARESTVLVCTAPPVAIVDNHARHAGRGRMS